MRPALEALCLQVTGGGQRLYLHHSPAAGTPVRGIVVQVHAWAEEMNKSRRMAAWASRALAAEGWAVLQHDLHGCGDSSGDFVDARWDDWLADIARAVAWARERHPEAELWLWGQRSGALLAVAAASRLPSPPHLLLWQPVPKGRIVAQQFLRLKAAAQLADGGGKAILEATKADLAAGKPVEIAGYSLHPQLLRSLETAELSPVDAQATSPRMVWLEVASQPDSAFSLPAQNSQAEWRQAGWQVDAEVIVGPPFWQTVEIEDAPALVAATARHLASAETAVREACPSMRPSRELCTKQPGVTR